ncbi:MAG: pilin [Patescibacteria group bacterium]
MKKTFLLLFIFSLFLLPQVTNAVSFYNPSGTLGLGTANLQATVIAIIQWILGLLGLIAVILVLYGGFTWMTAGGNEEKVEKAKKIITAAVIGLVIILVAWAIVIFALNVLQNTSGI